MGRHFQKLQEADFVPVSLSDRDMMDPDRLSLKAVAKRNKDAADRAEAEQAKKERAAANKAKYGQIEEIIKSGLKEADKKPSDILDDIFSIVVPREGKADTVAGEIVRAMMRVLYRMYNDGDKFYEGYGLETVAPSVAYLMDTIPAVDDRVRNMFEDLWKYDSDDAYEKALESMSRDCLDHILANIDTIFDSNEEDSRSWSGDTLEEIKENQPRYEYEISANDDIYTLIENDVISSQDLYEFVQNAIEWETVFSDADVQNPYSGDTSITVDNLTKDGLETIEDWTRNLDSFWEELTNEYQDELNAIENGEYDEDSEDEDDEDIDEALNNSQYDDKEDIEYAENIVRDYFRDVEDGYGYVTVDKAVDDLTNKDILVDDEIVVEYANKFNYPVMNFEDIQVILTASAPSRKDISKELGVDYDAIDESLKETSARPGQDRVLDALNNDFVDTDTLVVQLLRWMPDDELVKFADFYEYGISLDEDTINVNLVPDNIAPDHLVGDIHLDASGQSVGIAGGTGGTVSNTGHTSNSTNNTKRVLEPAKK